MGTFRAAGGAINCEFMNIEAEFMAPNLYYMEVMESMDGVLHCSQIDLDYCCQLIQEYSILDSAQLFVLMKKSDRLSKRQRHSIGKNLYQRGFALQIIYGGRKYYAKSPGIDPTGKYRLQIICFWVLLDYICKVDKHYATGTFSRISMEIDDRDYDIVYVKKGQERLCNSNMRSGGDVKYFVVVEDVKQIPLIKGDKIHTFATVSAKGQVEYYSQGG